MTDTLTRETANETTIRNVEEIAEQAGAPETKVYEMVADVSAEMDITNQQAAVMLREMFRYGEAALDETNQIFGEMSRGFRFHAALRAVFTCGLVTAFVIIVALYFEPMSYLSTPWSWSVEQWIYLVSATLTTIFLMKGVFNSYMNAYIKGLVDSDEMAKKRDEAKGRLKEISDEAEKKLEAVSDQQ